VYDRYRDKADFYLIYIREAHPTDSRRPAPHVKIAQPKTLQERWGVAQKFCTHFKLSIPTLVDDMNDSCSRAYNAFPDRLFILSKDGTIAYRGGRGPRGFKIDEMEKALQKILSAASGRGSSSEKRKEKS